MKMELVNKILKALIPFGTGDLNNHMLINFSLTYYIHAWVPRCMVPSMEDDNVMKTSSA